MEQRGVYICILWSLCAGGGIIGPQPGTEPSLAVRVLSPNYWSAWEIPKGPRRQEEIHTHTHTHTRMHAHMRGREK